MMQLDGLERFHHGERVVLEERLIFDKDLSAPRDEFPQVFLCDGRRRRRAEEAARLRGKTSRRELLRDALRYAKDVPRVFIIVLHERLAQDGGILRGIAEPPGYVLLEIQVEHVGGATIGIM